MAITKQYLKTKPICKVTFVVPAKEAASVSVAGEFNNWNTEATMLKKLKNGNFKGTIDLPKDNQFEFKYVVDGEWTNEIEADGYQWSDYASAENSLLIL
ncbi:isoamylase early set domain-containing protein [Aquimarina spongiae]|uniref:Glycogen recognition site of AMP-activated protein kinase n=1 Tax=Aquimarina spongiae TaxID=570521 RepID=A0A1M6E3J7_9FLAO|nr:isoamylase early set domain-containing protein [Aquimarina spongiae]SHI79950.1 Glycogen recognition site of AMP-activated protein kinase [Aquimarina spongiae]